MPDERVGVLIERIVAAARIPRRAARDDLRRELWSHFEEAGGTAERADEALRRFGDEALVIDSLRRVHRDEYLLVRIAGTLAAALACAAAAVFVEAVAGGIVRSHGGWHVDPAFVRRAGGAVAVVAGLIAAWEARRAPFSWSRVVLSVGAYCGFCLAASRLLGIGAASCLTASVLVLAGCACTRLGARPRDLAATFGVFALALYGRHLGLRAAFGAGQALLASAALVAVWAAAVSILRWSDSAIARLSGGADPHTV